MARLGELDPVIGMEEEVEILFKFYLDEQRIIQFCWEKLVLENCHSRVPRPAYNSWGRPEWLKDRRLVSLDLLQWLQVPTEVSSRKG